MLKIYKKIHKFSTVTTYFSMRKWDFSNNNTMALWEKLTPDDKDIFFFSMKDFNWEDFMQKCVRGLRLYVFKDDPENVPMARKRMARYSWVFSISNNLEITLSVVAVNCRNRGKNVRVFVNASSSLACTLRSNDDCRPIRASN